MSRQGLARSITPTRAAEALYPVQNSNYGPLPPINNPRRSSKNLEISPIRVTEQKVIEDQHQAERLKNNRSELSKRNENQASNYYFAPDPVANPSETRSQRLLKRFEDKPNFYNGWDQVVKGQAESEQRAMLEQKIEERLRKKRYKENLDQLVQQQQAALRKANYSSIRLGLSPYGSAENDYETEYKNATKAHQHSHKIQANVLNRGPSGYNANASILYEKEQRPQQSPENPQSQDNQHGEPDFEANNQSPPELRSKADQEELEKERDYLSKLYGIPRQEVQALYERVRHKSVPPRRPQDNSRNKSRERPIDDIIEENRQKKFREEDDEIRRIAEERKQKYQNTRRENEQLVQAKYLEKQMRKESQHRAYEKLMAQVDEGKLIEVMQKQSEKDYKRMYHDYLNWQIADKQQHRVSNNQLSRVERLMLLRANQDGKESSEFGTSPIPNGKNGYERRLQLSYIDRWLKYNPSLPPETHDRNRRSPHRDG